MSVEVRAVGVTCNLSCAYCYQHPIRDAQNFTAGYDLEAIKRTLEKHGQHFTLFGGEALLMPLDDLEELLRFGYEKWGHTSIQTNGTLLTDEHIALFKKYGVRPGISVDGPDELNDARWAGSLEKTREMTARTLEAIDRLCAAGIIPSIIVTMHRLNASRERRPRLKEWLRSLEDKGIWSVRLHELEVDHPLVRARLKLSDEEAIEAFRDMREFQKTLRRIRFDTFSDIENLLLGEDRSMLCIWNACDPWSTQAAVSVHPDGSETNCTRPFKDGVDWPKAEPLGFERYIALYHTPQEYGGCKGCRFFLMCKGQCPGTAIGGDWRNRSESCPLWKALMEDAEQELVAAGKQPLSLDPRREEMEAEALRRWAEGKRVSLWALREGGQKRCSCRPGEHGDVPHGDEHGDHWDFASIQNVKGVAPVGSP